MFGLFNYGYPITKLCPSVGSFMTFHQKNVPKVNKKSDFYAMKSKWGYYIG